MKKNLIITLLIAIFIIISKITMSQNENIYDKYSRLIVGTWKVDSLSINKQVLENMADDFKALAKQKLKEIVPNVEINVTSDKKWTTKGFPSLSSGVWEISKDGTTLSVKPLNDGPIQKSKIISITENKMIIEPINEKSINSAVYLYKVK